MLRIAKLRVVTLNVLTLSVVGMATAIVVGCGPAFAQMGGSGQLSNPGSGLNGIANGPNTTVNPGTDDDPDDRRTTVFRGNPPAGGNQIPPPPIPSRPSRDDGRP